MIGLSDYYLDDFPSEMIFSWLSSHGDIKKREFSFTLENGAYLRFLSFETHDEFQESLKKLRPCKIDVGAIYNIKPSERKSFNTSSFQPVEKELVFDIDVSDYDDIRSCCRGKEICNLCFKYCILAAKLLQATLRGTFSM